MLCQAVCCETCSFLSSFLISDLKVLAKKFVKQQIKLVSGLALKHTVITKLNKIQLNIMKTKTWPLFNHFKEHYTVICLFSTHFDLILNASEN